MEGQKLSFPKYTRGEEEEEEAVCMYELILKNLIRIRLKNYKLASMGGAYFFFARMHSHMGVGGCEGVGS